MRLTRARRFLVSLVVAVGVVGCRVGGNPSRSPVAHSPRGASLVILQGGPKRSRASAGAELLAVTESGLLVQTYAVFLYRFGTDISVRVSEAPGVPRVNLLEPDPNVLHDLAKYARHPYGLSAEQLGEILKALGQDSVMVVGG